MWTSSYILIIPMEATEQSSVGVRSMNALLRVAGTITSQLYFYLGLRGSEHVAHLKVSVVVFVDVKEYFSRTRLNPLNRPLPSPQTNTHSEWAALYSVDSRCCRARRRRPTPRSTCRHQDLGGGNQWSALYPFRWLDAAR
jgi:hypothetical protein